MSQNVNFICKDCNEKKMVPKYSYNGVTYKSSGQEITCPTCKKAMEYVEHFKGFPAVSVYAMKTKEEKRNILKKRAKDHYEKHIKEKKNFMHSQMTDALLRK